MFCTWHPITLCCLHTCEEDLADIDEASEETKEEAVEEATDETVEEAEQTEESKSEEVEEASDEAVEETVAGDQTADMIDDIKADEVGMTAEDDDSTDLVSISFRLACSYLAPGAGDGDRSFGRL